MTRAPKRIDDDNLNESNNGVDWYEKFENDDYFSIIWGPRLQTVADTAYIIKDYFFCHSPLLIGRENPWLREALLLFTITKNSKRILHGSAISATSGLVVKNIFSWYLLILLPVFYHSSQTYTYVFFIL